LPDKQIAVDFKHIPTFSLEIGQKMLMKQPLTERGKVDNEQHEQQAALAIQQQRHTTTTGAKLQRNRNLQARFHNLAPNKSTTSSQ
jgi:hypothetical protein